MFGHNRHIQALYTNIVKMYSNKRVLQQSNISYMQAASFSSNICVFEIKPAQNVTCDCNTIIFFFACVLITFV